MEARSFKLNGKEFKKGDKIGDWEVSRVEMRFFGHNEPPMMFVIFKKGNSVKTIEVDFHGATTENSLKNKLSRGGKRSGGKRSTRKRSTRKRKTHRRKSHKRSTHKRRH